ncbi:sigma-70 family RNA polymerase sigma factor [Streptomyces boluensis]|uniref:Sigma-70 family RNA polymerase sigma factor n=1 Tax=Streptomyces boluensis TaxID=1775135 RepID=A0A964UN86_9ACTN|nr:sigma-70 family RNA polymerase sigma factor [Streptomyces boluensis]NBE50908.1 sigma-70 family RNA polymerase sigma factor [Streptomyces boluensis]
MIESAIDSTTESTTESTAEALLADLDPLLTAEAAAEAADGGLEQDDLQQAVWLRLLERLDRSGPPATPERWLRDHVHLEASRARRVRGLDRWYGVDRTAAQAWPERALLRAEHRRAVRAVVRRLPGRCAPVLTAFTSPRDLTYREIAGELGMSQGSLGPERSRCLGCLRRMLPAEVAPPGPRAKVRGRQPADR